MPTKSKMIIRLIAAGYLVYCSIGAFRNIGNQELYQKILLIIGATIILLAGIAILIQLIVSNKK